MAKNIFIAIVLFLLTLSNAQAAVSPVAVGIVPPIQFPPSDFSVTGFRLSGLWGSHRDIYGVDLGLIGNITAQDFTGIALSGVFNRTKGTTTAIGGQIAGLVNWNDNKTSVYGLQFAALNYNKATSKVVGLDLGLINLTEQTAIYGVQAGIYNKARVVYGFQIGLVNETTDLHGVQIGLVNFYHKGLFVVSPIINVGF